MSSAFVAGDAELIEILIRRARSCIDNTTSIPALARISLSAAHTKTDVDRLEGALRRVEQALP